MEWVYVATLHIRTHLSAKIQMQTLGVDRGDLLGLLRAISMSMHCFDQFQGLDIETDYYKCTMAGQCAGDLMTYISALTVYVRRLVAAGHAPSDSMIGVPATS